MLILKKPTLLTFWGEHRGIGEVVEPGIVNPVKLDGQHRMISSSVFQALVSSQETV